MRKSRFMNMPFSIWLISIVVAAIANIWLYDRVSNTTPVIVSLIVVIVVWFCYDRIVPTIEDAEFVWLCDECFEAGVVIMLSPLIINDTLTEKVFIQHRDMRADTIPCGASTDNIDVYRGRFKLTCIHPWAQFQVWRALLKQRNKLAYEK